MRNEVPVVKSHYSKEIDHVANYRETATDAYLWERRLSLSVIDQLIALAAFMGAALFLVHIH